jgi:hypothetical protein
MGGLTARYVLSPVEFDVLWAGLHLGPTPVVLRLPSAGRTHAERRHIEADAWAALRHRGLTGQQGPQTGLVQLLRVLAGADRRLEVRAWSTSAVRALAAGGGGDTAALAVHGDDAVVVGPWGSLSSAATAVLPPLAPGPGRAANVPTASLVSALRSASGAGPRADLVHHGDIAEEAGPLTRMLRGVRWRAQVGASVADRWGSPRRCGQVLGVLDGPRGRYLTTRSRSDDGVDWTTVAPVDDRRLRLRVTALLAQAASDR